MTSLTEHVRGKSRFSHARAGHLYYLTDTGLEFPIPFSDMDDATFQVEDKSLLFMRWIRAHLKTVEDGNNSLNETREVVRKPEKFVSEPESDRYWTEPGCHPAQSKEDVKADIKAYFDKHHGEIIYTSDVATALSQDYWVVEKLIHQLVQEGKIVLVEGE